MFGNAGEQVIHLLTIPIILRLYSPEQYGVFTLFFSLAAIILPVSSLRYQAALLLPENKEDTVSILIICFGFVSLISALIAAAGVIVNHTGIRLPSSYLPLKPYIWLLAIYVLVAGVNKAIDFLMIRTSFFTVQSISNVSRVLFNRAVAIGYALSLSRTTTGLIISLIVGSSVACYIVVRYGLISFLKGTKRIRVERIRDNFFKYKDYAIFSGSVFIEGFTRQLAPILFGVYFNAAIVGYLGLSIRLIQQPASLLGDAVFRSFFHLAAVRKRAGEPYGDAALDLFAGLVAITFVPGAILAVIAPDVVNLFFGDKWRPAGLYLSVFSCTFLLHFLYRPFSIIFDVQQKQSLRFWMTILSLLQKVALFYGCIWVTRSPLTVTIVYSSTSSMFTLANVLYLLYLVGVPPVKTLTIVLKHMLLAMATGGAVLLTNKWLNLPAIGNVLIGMGLAGVFLSYMFFVDPRLNRILKSIVRFGKKKRTSRNTAGD